MTASGGAKRTRGRLPEILVYVPPPGDAGHYRDLILARHPDAVVHAAADPESVAEAIDRCEVLFGWMVPPKLFDAAAGLRWMQKTGAGVEDVLASNLPAHVVLTRSEGGLLAPRMIEYALGAIFGHAQKFGRARAQQARNRWDYYPVDRAGGRTLGIAGLGDIGRRLAARAALNELRVLGWRRTPRDEDAVNRVYTGRDGLLEMLGQSDYVVSVLPHTPETASLFDAEAFAAMPAGAVFVNIGRGGAVVEEALIEALQSGHLGGATLDVFRKEPLPPDSPLWSAPNIQITPHVSGPIMPDDVVPFFLENLERYMSGEPLLRQVDRSAGY